MPHTRSAKKNVRKIEKRRLANRAAKKAIRTQIKKVEEIAAQGGLDQLRQEYNLAARSSTKPPPDASSTPTSLPERRRSLANCCTKRKPPPRPLTESYAKSGIGGCEAPGPDSVRASRRSFVYGRSLSRQLPLVLPTFLALS